MKKFVKAIIKADFTTAGLANAVCDVMIEYYGDHNYERFIEVINERLKVNK